MFPAGFGRSDPNVHWIDVAELHQIALGTGFRDRLRDMLAGTVQKLHWNRFARAIKARQDRPAQHEIAQSGARIGFIELRHDWSQVSASDLQDLPTGAHALRAAEESGSTDVTSTWALTTRRSIPAVIVAAVRCVDARIQVGGHDTEMRLVQTPEHLIHDSAHRVQAIGGFDLRPEFVVDRLPIQAARLGLPMLVADRRPDVFEGLEAELALLGCERGG